MNSYSIDSRTFVRGRPDFLQLPIAAANSGYTSIATACEQMRAFWSKRNAIDSICEGYTKIVISIIEIYIITLDYVEWVQSSFIYYTYLSDASICQTPVCNACHIDILFHQHRLKLGNTYYWRRCVCLRHGCESRSFSLFCTPEKKKERNFSLKYSCLKVWFKSFPCKVEIWRHVFLSRFWIIVSYKATNI